MPGRVRRGRLWAKTEEVLVTAVLTGAPELPRMRTVGRGLPRPAQHQGAGVVLALLGLGSHREGRDRPQGAQAAGVGRGRGGVMTADRERPDRKAQRRPPGVIPRAGPGGPVDMSTRAYII